MKRPKTLCLFLKDLRPKDVLPQRLQLFNVWCKSNNLQFSSTWLTYLKITPQHTILAVKNLS